jgi:hypothetical protein
VSDAICLVSLNHGYVEKIGVFPPLLAIRCKIFVSRVSLPVPLFLRSGCLEEYPAYLGLSRGLVI